METSTTPQEEGSRLSIRSTHFLRTYWYVLCAVLLCGGVLLWYVFATPVLLGFSDSFRQETQVVSFDNFYDEAQQEFLGEERSDTIFTYSTVGREGDTLAIENTFDVRTQTGEPIFSVTRLYGVDAQTGQHVPGIGDRDREGYLLAPRMKGVMTSLQDKSSFTYWHVNYNTPLELVFQEEETILGLTTYRYEVEFSTDQTEELASLPGVGVTRGVSLEGKLTVWIEPVSGRRVKYQDSATAYFYDITTKERLSPWNSFRNQTSTVSVGKQVLSASLEKAKIYLYTLVIPALVLVLALFLLIHKPLLSFLGFGDDLKHKALRLPIIAFVITLALSVLLINFIGSLIEQARTSEFQFEVDKTHDAITNRLEIYTNAINGSRGFFEASQHVDRHEWQAYVTSLGIHQNYPGIQGLGYSTWIPADQLESHIASVQEEGFAEYTVRPEGIREQYTSIVFIEPFDDRNKQAFGFDMYQEATRRQAMQRARDTGEAALTAKVTLVQEIDENVQAGFLIYVPVYKQGEVVVSLEDRQQAIQGFVYSPFRMNNFINGVLFDSAGEIEVEIFDGETDIFSEDKRMFGSSEHDEDTFVAIRPLHFGGHTWTVRYTATSDYRLDLIRKTAEPVIFGGALLLGIFFFLVLYGINTRREKAFVLAQSMTADLRQRTEDVERIEQELTRGNNELTQKAQMLSEKIQEVEEINKHMVGREIKMAELKEQIKRLQGGTNK